MTQPISVEVQDVESGIADTLTILGVTTAPVANFQITNTIAPPAGIYEVEVIVSLSGAAPAAADCNNVYLQYNGGTKVVPSAPGVVSSKFRLTLNGTNNVALNASAGATAGVIYAVYATFRRVG